jgi:hypothetical protein
MMRNRSTLSAPLPIDFILPSKLVMPVVDIAPVTRPDNLGIFYNLAIFSHDLFDILMERTRSLTLD